MDVRGTLMRAIVKIARLVETAEWEMVKGVVGVGWWGGQVAGARSEKHGYDVCCAK